ncbi:hypothetical protein AB0230_05140 [Microbacterium sp. NPDC089190]|uniref:hypothetical protein n=1 Tax=Microbacterium sp. NPDC089190 TaxID=3155063 RepID=UPI00344EE397
MTTRTRPAALDGHSLEADCSVDPAVKVRVEVEIRDILRRIGAGTDDQIIAIYDSRVEHYPDVPAVSEQRIRTARAAMVRRGAVGADPKSGLSKRGNTATRWRLTG